MRLVHGSPRKVNEYLFEDKPARKSASPPGRTATCWSSAHPQALGARVRRSPVRQLRAVGKPKDGDPRAAFAILEAGAREIEVSIERVDYDAEAVAREVAEAGLPVEYAEKLLIAA